MSDVNFYGVLQMPYELAMSDELSRRQFYSVVQEAVKRLHKLEQPARTIKESLNVEPAQEPVGYFVTCNDETKKNGIFYGFRLELKDAESLAKALGEFGNVKIIEAHTHPAPAREPLSDEDFRRIIHEQGINLPDDYAGICQAVERAHWIGVEE